MTPTPNGSRTIRITPGTARAAASSTSIGAPYLGAEDAQRLEVAADGVGAGRVHDAPEAGVAVDLVVRRRGNDAHLRPVGVQLLGDDQRQRGERALTHLDGRRLDVDRAVG